MPLPAKGAVAPMPSRTAGLFASRGAGRAAGAACVRKVSFWRSMRSLAAVSRVRRDRPASESRVYQSRRVSAASTASGATLPRAGPAAPLRRAGGGIARFAASTTSGQRTRWHAWIGFSQADLMRSQPSGGRRMAAMHRVDRWSRRRRARAAIYGLRHPGLRLRVNATKFQNSWTRRCVRTGATNAAALPSDNARTTFILAQIVQKNQSCTKDACGFLRFFSTCLLHGISGVVGRAVKPHA